MFFPENVSILEHTLGVPALGAAEIIPFGPDPVSTGVGKSHATTWFAHSAPMVPPKVVKSMHMEVLVNNQTIQTPANCTISKLMPLLGISNTQGLAVAVNEQVIAKANWLSYELLPDDKIMLIKATQGG